MNWIGTPEWLTPEIWKERLLLDFEVLSSSASRAESGFQILILHHPIATYNILETDFITFFNMLSYFRGLARRPIQKGRGLLLSASTYCRSIISKLKRKRDKTPKKIYRPAIATMSLGKPGLHSLVFKLRAASVKGFQGVELYWDDLMAHTQELSLNLCGSPDESDLLMGARDIKKLCDNLHLEIIALQPFRDYDGITEPELHDQRLTEFRTWLLVARELGTNTIGVPPTITGNQTTHTGDESTIVRDLIDLAALARPLGIRIAYENLCFGAHVRS